MGRGVGGGVHWDKGEAAELWSGFMFCGCRTVAKAGRSLSPIDPFAPLVRHPDLRNNREEDPVVGSDSGLLGGLDCQAGTFFCSQGKSCFCPKLKQGVGYRNLFSVPGEREEGGGVLRYSDTAHSKE